MRWMDGWRRTKKVGRNKGRKEGRKDGRKVGWKKERMNERMDKITEGRMDTQERKEE